jgi:hypothetical protein
MSEIRKVLVSNEGDGAFAVVDVDTLWQNTKTKMIFIGKADHARCTKMSKDGKWKMIAPMGLLDYGIKRIRVSGQCLWNHQYQKC